jgi:prophage regulatory protein
MQASEEPPRFLPPPVVTDRTSLSRTTLWRMVRAGEFPKPIAVSPGRVAWSEAEVNAWMAARANAREAE